MKRALMLFALAALALALPAGVTAYGASHAKSHPKAKSKTKVYKGTFRAVGADGAYSNRKFGRAQLVDGKKNDKLTVHVRKLAPKTTYAYGLYKTAKGGQVCEQGASGGALVTDFTYKPKQTNSAGNFNTKSRSKTFTSDPTTSDYFVLVYTTKPDGSSDQAVACAPLKYKKAKKAKKHGAKHHAKGKAKGHAKAQPKSHGKANGKGKNK